MLINVQIWVLYFITSGQISPNSASQRGHGRFAPAIPGQNVSGGKFRLLTIACNPILFLTDCEDP